MVAAISSSDPGGTNRRSDLTKQRLSTARQRLVTLMQLTYFGRIERLSVRAGEPILDPAPRVIRTVKLAGRNASRPQATSADFALKLEWVEFFEHLDTFGDGVVLVIEIGHGLPLYFEFEHRDHV